MTREELLNALNWRYATKRFDPSKKLSQENWAALEETLRLAPSAYGLQPWKFIVVENPKLRKTLREASWNQPQITEASHMVVFCHKRTISKEDVGLFIRQVSATRGVPEESMKEYRAMMVGDLVDGPRAKIIEAWTQRQTYIAVGFLLEAAALLKVDACPMEGFDPKAYDRILGLEGSPWASVAVVTLGYRSPEDPYQNLKKVRYDKSTVIDPRK
jgi:nitroreductase